MKWRKSLEGAITLEVMKRQRDKGNPLFARCPLILANHVARQRQLLISQNKGLDTFTFVVTVLESVYDGKLREMVSVRRWKG